MNKAVIFLIIGLTGGFISGGIINYYIFSDENLFFPFKDLVFEENEYFDFTWSKLHSRNDIITTNERVLLRLEFTNKQPIPLMIEPEIYTRSGNTDYEKQTIPPTTYGGDIGPTSKTNSFSAPPNEGENYFKIALKISHGNGTFINYLNDTVTYNILSPESAIQERQNSTLLGSVVVAGFVGAGTVAALIWTNKISKKEIKLQEDQIKKINKQNKFLKEQGDFDNRPWIGATLGIQDHPTISNRMMFHYKNYGNTPAFKVKENGGCQETRPTKEDVKAMGSLDAESMLVPQQEVIFGFNGDSTMMEKSKKGENDLYFWIIIRYQRKGGNGEYGIIYHVDHNTDAFNVEEEWTDFE